MRKARLLRIAAVVLIALALAALLLQSVMETLRGNGAGTYENAKGMRIQWVAVLVFAGTALAALLVGWAMRWWSGRDDRAIDRALRAKHASSRPSADRGETG